MKHLIAALTASAFAAACAPVIQGGPPMDLPPGLVETARVTSVVLSTEWLDAEGDFADTFSEEVMEELDLCAYGSYPLQLRVHVEDLDRAGRLEVLLAGDGEHRLRAVAELRTEPKVWPGEGELAVSVEPVEVMSTMISACPAAGAPSVAPRLSTIR